MSNDFFEKTLEEIIVQNKEIISQKGFPSLLENTVPQFRLPSGKYIDILTFSINEEYISAKVIELKREVITPEALCQVSDYASEFYAYCYPHFRGVSMERFVIGTDVSKDAKSLNDAMISIELYLYRYTINGVYFKKYESFLESSHPDLMKVLSEPSPASCLFFETLKGINNQNAPQIQ